MPVSEGRVRSVAAPAVDRAMETGVDLQRMFDMCSAVVYRYVVVRVHYDRQLADEVMQQLWLQVCKSSRRIPAREYEFWLKGIAKNLIRDHWRKVNRRPNHVPLHPGDSVNEPLTRFDSQILPTEQLEQRELHEQLTWAITELPSADQDLIVHHYVNGESFQDIAARFGISERAVEGRLYRARQKLREALSHLAGADD